MKHYTFVVKFKIREHCDLLDWVREQSKLMLFYGYYILLKGSIAHILSLAVSLTKFGNNNWF